MKFHPNGCIVRNPCVLISFTIHKLRNRKLEMTEKLKDGREIKNVRVYMNFSHLIYILPFVCKVEGLVT